MKVLSDKLFFGLIDNLDNSKHPNFYIEERKSLSYLFVDDKIYASKINSDKVKLTNFWGEGISFQQGISMYGNIVKEVKSHYFKENEGSLPDVIEYKFVKSKNKEFYEGIKDGAIFYSIDLNNAWLLMCLKLNYISEKNYLMWKNQYEYKSVFQRFLPLLSSDKKRWTLKEGKKVSIESDYYQKSYKVMYENVRSLASSFIEGAINEVKERYIYANIDDIAVMPEDRLAVAKYFDANKLDYKLTICEKINNEVYLKNGKECKF